MAHSDSEADLILRFLDEKISTREQVIVDGHASTLEEYRHLCGVIEGLRMARNEVYRRQKLYETE